jgi:hypothetical protein
VLESVALTNPHHPERVAPSRLRRLTPRSADQRSRAPVSVDRELQGVGDERVRAQVLMSLGPNRAQSCVSLRRLLLHGRSKSVSVRRGAGDASRPIVAAGGTRGPRFTNCSDCFRVQPGPPRAAQPPHTGRRS